MKKVSEIGLKHCTLLRIEHIFFHISSVLCLAIQKINQLESVTGWTKKLVWWRSINAVSNYNRHKRTHKLTDRQDIVNTIQEKQLYYY